MHAIALGIDLGTTNTCVAYFTNGRPQIIENSEGDRLTPSFLFHTGSKIVAGKTAQRMSVRRPDFGIYEIKRLLGRKFDDPDVQKSLKYFPFRVEPDDNNEPVIVIVQASKEIKLTPIELSAEILKNVKKDAESKLGGLVEDAVITVPAYFNIRQREATLEAAQKAGFKVLKLLNEPTAAALSYFLDKPCQVGEYFLVFDFGGGTFDVAILQKREESFDIICVDGDTALGGHDIDNLIINYVSKALSEDYNYNPLNDKRQLRRLKNFCEDAKKNLSNVAETEILLDGFVPERRCVDISLSRKQLDDKAGDIFNKIRDVIDNSLKSCNLSRGDIKEIILAGGSTRIPKVRSILSDYFPDTVTISKFINADESVAEGASIQAAIIKQLDAALVQKIQIKDVTPLSLGVADFVNRMNFAIKRNTPIPVKSVIITKNIAHNQTDMNFAIFEGERVNCKYNRLLGTLKLKNITPAPPNQIEVNLVMQIDQNGILHITAQEKSKNNVKNLKIDYAKEVRRSEERVKNALKDARDNSEEDEKFGLFASSVAYLKKYCIAVMYNLDNLNLKPESEDIYKVCEDTLESVGLLQNLDEVRDSIKHVKDECQKVVEKYNFQNVPDEDKC